MRKNLILLKKGNGKHNLFFIHAGSGEITPYINFCNELTIDINCWGIRQDSFDDLTPKNFTIESISDKYIKLIKTVQNKGEYFLFGWCFGGTRAFEIARQLELSGHKIGFLSLINSNPPLTSEEEKKRMIKQYSLILDDPHQTNFQNCFSKETEIVLAKEWLTIANLQDIIEDDLDFSDIWLTVAEYFENTEHEKLLVNTIKKSIPSDRAGAIPFYENINLRSLLYYLSVLRSDANAQAYYIPKTKIKTAFHYFEASEDRISRKNLWNNHCEKEQVGHLIQGNHFSIFNIPKVYEFAGIFSNIFKDSIK